MIKTLKTLYKIDSKGKIRIWYSEVEDDKYRIISGLKDGKLVTSEWTVTLPKNVGRANETTAVEQALKEAEALYDKQQAQGGYFDSIDDINNETYFEPMLAYAFVDNKQHVQNAFDRGEKVYSSFKLDGFRNCSVLTGMFTRKGKPYFSSPHISYPLINLFQDYPNITLDGELYNHELHDDFNKLQSLITKKKPTNEDLLETRDKVQYHVYDLHLKDNPNAKFSERYEILNDLANIYFDGTKIQLVESVPCASFEDIDSAYGIALQNAYEGQIIRLDTSYENKRTKNLLKRKEFFDAEYVIKDILPGLGNWQSCAKSLLFELPNGKEFSAGIRGSMEEMHRLLEDKNSFIGVSEATIRYPNLTPDGIPRFPVVTNIFKGKRDI